jgi:hypothetical protein
LRGVRWTGPRRFDGVRAAQAKGSDHDFAQRNSGSDPFPGTQGAVLATRRASQPFTVSLAEFLVFSASSAYPSSAASYQI